MKRNLVKLLVAVVIVTGVLAACEKKNANSSGNNGNDTTTNNNGNDNHGLHYTVPENLKVVFNVTRDGVLTYTQTIIKVGGACYSSEYWYSPPSEVVVKAEYYLKPNTPTAGKWTRYERMIITGIEDSGWEKGSTRDNWWNWFGDIDFLDFMGDGASYRDCQNGVAKLAGTEVIAGVSTNKYIDTSLETVTITYWIDPVTKLFFKQNENYNTTPAGTLLYEVTSWSTTASLSGIDLP